MKRIGNEIGDRFSEQKAKISKDETCGGELLDPKSHQPTLAKYQWCCHRLLGHQQASAIILSCHFDYLFTYPIPEFHSPMCFMFLFPLHVSSFDIFAFHHRTRSQFCF